MEDKLCPPGWWLEQQISTKDYFAHHMEKILGLKDEVIGKYKLWIELERTVRKDCYAYLDSLVKEGVRLTDRIARLEKTLSIYPTLTFAESRDKKDTEKVVEQIKIEVLEARRKSEENAAKHKECLETYKTLQMILPLHLVIQTWNDTNTDEKVKQILHQDSNIAVNFKEYSDLANLADIISKGLQRDTAKNVAGTPHYIRDMSID
jgi:hypothetical protein